MTKASTSLLVILSLLTALSTARLFPLGLDLAFPSMGHQILDARLMFLLHISAASVALACGALQIIPAVRKRYLNVHRWVGRLYALAVLLASFSGFLIAFQIEGIIGTTGFALLAVIWLIVTGQAVRLARTHQIQAHRRWMICSFALTFAAVSLRLQLAIFMFGLAMPYEQVYPFLAWSCWAPNLVFAFWYVGRS